MLSHDGEKTHISRLVDPWRVRCLAGICGAPFVFLVRKYRDGTQTPEKQLAWNERKHQEWVVVITMLPKECRNRIKSSVESWFPSRRLWWGSELRGDGSRRLQRLLLKAHLHVPYLLHYCLA